MGRLSKRLGFNIKKDFAGAAETIIRQYFSGTVSVYDEPSFEKRFGTPRQVMMRIIDTITSKDPFTLEKSPKKNRVEGKLVIHLIVQFVVTFRMSVYGECADRLDDQLHISEATVNRTLRAFCTLIVKEFKDEYYNQRSTDDAKARLLELMRTKNV